jgi:hypothetical protein
MVYLVTNITDSSLDPKTLYIADIPGLLTVAIKPGQTIDLEYWATRNQICESHHLRVHVNEGRMVVDTLGTEPDKDCRIWVTGIDIGDITIDNVSLDEPVQISADVGGVETPLTASSYNSKVYLDVNPLYPNTPFIDQITIPSVGTPVPYALPIDTRKYLVLAGEDDHDLEVGFAPDGYTIPVECGTSYSEVSVDAGSVTLYFKSNKAPRTVKVLTWSIA